MIYDILDDLDTLVQDSTNGINAALTSVNAAKGTSAPAIQEFMTWSHNKLPSEMTLPTFLQVYERSYEMEPTGQGKWRGKHIISWQYWAKETNASQARKDITISAHAFRTVVNLIPSECSTVDVVLDESIMVSGWQLQGKLYVWMGYTFTVKERDENP